MGAAGLAMTGRATSAFAQTVGRIESTAPELANIISTSEPIRQLATGFGGDIGPAEGPLWMSDGRYLLFNDIQTARRMKYTPGSGAAVAMEKTNEANGITRDLQGRIISAEHLTRRVTRYEPDGSVTVVANSFQGKRLLRPNDVIVKSDGTIYFTDPGGTAAPEQWDVTLSGVYRVSGDLGSMSLVVDDMVRPNGLALSPDESILYIADSRRRHVRAYDLLPNGMAAMETSRVFVDLNGAEPGVPDGIKVDTAGNLYSGGAGGLYIMDNKGRKLGADCPRATGDDEYRVRRRRLEDALLHHQEHALLRQSEDRRRPGAGEEEGDVSTRHVVHPSKCFVLCSCSRSVPRSCVHVRG
jgi:gluconolactonase